MRILIVLTIFHRPFDSASKGKKMVSDTQKLLLRAFNNECDVVVGKVKYTNFDASLNRINKSAETISKLGTIMGISISFPFFSCICSEKTPH